MTAVSFLLCCDIGIALAAEFKEFWHSCVEDLVLLWYYTDLVSMTSFCYHNYLVLQYCGILLRKISDIFGKSN